MFSKKAILDALIKLADEYDSKDDTKSADLIENIIVTIAALEEPEEDSDKVIEIEISQEDANELKNVLNSLADSLKDIK